MECLQRMRENHSSTNYIKSIKQSKENVDINQSKE
jgi:hypothetical protein